MKLSRNFTLEELIRTNTGLLNNPDEACREKLLYLATYILQPIRDKFGTIDVTSGFRSDEVNKAIGGSTTSQHLKGEAADITSPVVSLDIIWKWIDKNLIYGQAINERAGTKRWIHISLPRLNKPDQMFMTYANGKYTIIERS